MKVIELLTLIAKGEEVPKKIKYLDNEFEYNDINKFYYDKGYSMYRLMFGEGNCLNDEVEIIEEEKKIEKCKSYEDFEGIDDYIEHLRSKINVLIDEVNKLKRDKNE